MSTPSAEVVIIGAGSVGIVAGYDLTRAGAHVTYLVRPHRTEQLSHPQALYSYDDNTLDHFSAYDVIADPAALASTPADLVIVTLDGAALRSDASQQLVRAVGAAYRDSETPIVLATGGIGIRDWFVAESELTLEQVAMGSATTLIHDISAAALPVDPAVDAELLNSADYAYRRLSSVGFSVDDNAPKVAEAIVSAFESGALPAVTVPADQTKLGVAGLAPLLAWGLLGWKPLDEIDANDSTWELGVDSMREVQSLSVFGAAGRAAAKQTEPAAVLESFRQTTQAVRPLDYAAFNAYHHGDKVNQQNLDILTHAANLAKADGLTTPALDDLIMRLTEK
ncbi:ketopantoate reductase [Microbacteriaceae bacterium VKM Ac-2855]|nr:ketopantoate reductase [Microbacteriaceae bacterium VKM Ac-2855]